MHSFSILAIPLLTRAAQALWENKWLVASVLAIKVVGLLMLLFYAFAIMAAVQVRAAAWSSCA